MNGPIMTKKIESLLKSLPSKKSPGSEVFTAKFDQTSKEELISICLKVFQKIEERILPNSFHEANLTLKQKPDKETRIKKIIG